MGRGQRDIHYGTLQILMSEINDNYLYSNSRNIISS